MSVLLLFHAGGLGADEILLYAVPLLLGLVLMWALSRRQHREADPGDALESKVEEQLDDQET